MHFAVGTFRGFIVRRLRGSIAIGAGVIVIGSTAALASIPDSAGVIHGCYKAANGQLRIIDPAADSCNNDEAAIQWNQTGPEGPAGPQGPAGPPGPAGQGGTPVYFQEMAFCGSGGNPSPNTFVGNAFGFALGTFTSPAQLPSGGGCAGASYRRHITFDVQNLNGVGGPVAVGTGTITCDPCSVAGKSGAVNFSLTVFGAVQTDSGGNPVGAANLGGTWTVTGASGGLTGLVAQGTYGSTTSIISSDSAGGSCCFASKWVVAEVFIGTYTLPA